MPTYVRPLSLLACAAGACALAPSAALAATQSGVVLSAAHHRVQLVDRNHRVADARVRSTRGLRRGAVVTVRGGSAKVTGRAHRVAFLGRVARTSKHGTVLTLGDESSLKLGTASARGARAASTSVSLQGLTAGETLLVTISTDAQGNVAIAIKVVPAATNIGDEQQTSGYVTDDSGGGTFAIRTGDGSGLRFDDPQQLLEAADASQCDTVDVGYHADGHALVADTLKVTGTSDQGSCAPDQQQTGDDSSGDEVDGVVTALAPDGSSLTIAPDDGSAADTIQVSDASVLDGVNVGDDVAVMTDDSGVATEVDVLDTSGEDPGSSGDG
jgi:hypothetical protein